LAGRLVNQAGKQMNSADREEHLAGKLFFLLIKTDIQLEIMLNFNQNTTFNYQSQAAAWLFRHWGLPLKALSR
jgi:hypothetical protein